MTEITQADRDLCNELWKMSVNWGNREDMEDMISRHRIQAVEQAQVEINRMREAIATLTAPHSPTA